MNYQDFESAWYLGIVTTGFFCVMVVGLAAVLRNARSLAAREGGVITAMVIAGSLFTFFLLFACCMALLIGIVSLAGG
ncbi:MAG: hypothetical protein ACREOL_10140 [Candidatus Dormibacteria bacterium]